MNDETIKELEKENQMLRDMLQLDKGELDRFIKTMREKAEKEQRMAELASLMLKMLETEKY